MTAHLPPTPEQFALLELWNDEQAHSTALRAVLAYARLGVTCETESHDRLALEWSGLMAVREALHRELAAERDASARSLRVVAATRALVTMYDARWVAGVGPAVSLLRDPCAGSEVWGDLLCALAALDSESVPVAPNALLAPAAQEERRG